MLIGNLIGSLFVAYFLAVKTGVIGMNGADPASPAGMTFERLKAIAVLKGDTEGADQIFLRALGCNWLVCLAVWVAMTAEDTGGKILGIFFPIMAFVAIGFDHVVANMFFLPAAIFAEVPGITLGRRALQLGLRVPRELRGAAIFVSTAYWYLYLRETPDEDGVGPTGAEPEDAQAGDGRATAEGPSARVSPTRSQLATASEPQKAWICREYYVPERVLMRKHERPPPEERTCADPPSWARPRRPRSPPARWRSAMAPGSSHREAPKILADPTADNTDVYAFTAPDAPGSLTVVANWIPLEEPAGGPYFGKLDPEARYYVKIDNTGDGRPDVAYRWEFDQRFRNPDSFLDAAPTVDSIDDPDLNFVQTYDLYRETYRGKKVQAQRIANDVPVAPANIGPKTIPDYGKVAAQAIRGVAGGGKTFVGPVDDPFFVDLGAVFDGINIDKPGRPNIGLGNQGGGKDDVAGYNTHAFVLQVPESQVTRDGKAVAGRGRLERRRRRVGDHRAPPDLRPPPRQGEGEVGPGQPARQPADQRGRDPDRPEGPLQPHGARRRRGELRHVRGRARRSRGCSTRCSGSASRRPSARTSCRRC